VHSSERLAGDNVVERSERTPWYSGPSLLEYLETVPLAPLHEQKIFRFPVQYVFRRMRPFRGFAGPRSQWDGSRGDVVTALPADGNRASNPL